MVGLSYVGAQAVASTDITNRLAVNTVIDAVTPNQPSVAAQAAGLVGTTYASLTYVNNLNATFETPSYYQTQDQLAIPTTSAGIASGVAQLDSTDHVPAAQLPTLGAGYVTGGWGPTATYSGTTDATPLKIADWNIGPAELSFRPAVFLLAFVSSIWDQPVIEVRISNTTTAPTDYADTTLVATGEGRYLYNDFHTVVVLPGPDSIGESYPALLSPTYNVWLSAWLYGLQNQSVTIAEGGIASGAAYLVRGAE